MIENINEKEIKYSTVAKQRSPGSPILNGEFKILGLESQNVGPNKWKAIRINQVFEAYKSELLNRYGGRTENDIWLELIRNIPQNELNFIMRGSYGTVYKVIEQNDSVYALKLVERFGNHDDDKNKVHALENEYRLVTSLQHHPRII